MHCLDLVTLIEGWTINHALDDISFRMTNPTVTDGRMVAEDMCAIWA